MDLPVRKLAAATKEAKTSAPNTTMKSQRSCSSRTSHGQHETPWSYLTYASTRFPSRDQLPSRALPRLEIILVRKNLTLMMLSNDLLCIGAISKCQLCCDQFLSSVFLVPKPNEKMRVVLNLKSLEKFTNTTF